MNKQLTTGIKLSEIIESYDDKINNIDAMHSDIVSKHKKLRNVASMMGVVVGSYPSYDYEFKADNLKEHLKMSAWRYLYNQLNIKDIAPKTHLKEFENLLQNPPDFNIDNIKSIFKDYVLNPRSMAIKAFAEIFSNLDPFYKSHENFKVGVKGLPKRVIITGNTGYFNNYAFEKTADVVSALMRYKGKPDCVINSYDVEKIAEYGGEALLKFNKEIAEYNANKQNISHVMPQLDEENYLGTKYYGLEIKLFKNGNVHIIFDKESMDGINKCLAEYYGEVLPDAYEHTEKKSESKAVSKDLQFYRTPKEIADGLVSDIYFQEDDMVLEPSCGDGALLDAIKKDVLNRNVKNVRMLGIEFNVERCEMCRNKGYNVYQDNFLTLKTNNKFDKIIMNPPFYGKHYAKHIAKAYELLADDGEIHAILPITAKISHGIIEEKYRNVRWHELPMGSFSESGTNVNTCILKIRK